MRKRIIGGLALILGVAVMPMTAEAATQIADCDSNSGALSNLLAGPGLLGPGDVIEVDGACIGGGEIRTDDLTIEDSDSNATVAGELGVNGARRVTIQNLRIDGSPGHGIVVSNSGSITANNLVIENCEAEGAAGVILVHNSSAVLNDVTIRNASYGVSVGDSGHVIVANTLIEQIASNGVDVFNGSVATLDNVTIRGAHSGVVAYGNSYVEVQNGSVIENSIEPGIGLNRGADALVTGSTIQNNGGNGIGVDTNCSAIIDDATIQGNGGEGIIFWQGGNGLVTNSTIENNGGGILVSFSSSANLSGNTIQGNPYGVAVGSSASARLRDNTITISTPDEAALDMSWGGSARLEGGNTLTAGPGGYSIFLQQGTTLTQKGALDTAIGKMWLRSSSNAEFRNIHLTGSVAIEEDTLLRIRNTGSPSNASVTGNISLSKDSAVNFIKDAGDSKVRIVGNVVCADTESSISAAPSDVTITGSKATCTGY